MLLGVDGLFKLATGRLKDGLEVRIDDERCFSTKLILVEFILRLLGARHWEHMEHRDKIVSSAKLCVSCEDFITYKVTEAS